MVRGITRGSTGAPPPDGPQRATPDRSGDRAPDTQTGGPQSGAADISSEGREAAQKAIQAEHRATREVRYLFEQGLAFGDQAKAARTAGPPARTGRPGDEVAEATRAAALRADTAASRAGSAAPMLRQVLRPAPIDLSA